MSKNPAQQLIDFGQSVWYDNISRELLDNGELKRFIAEWGVRGLTSNPSIFDKAISDSSVYDASIENLKKNNLSADEVFEALAIDDIGRAADLLLPIYESSNGDDGFVSIEVSPLLASDTDGTITEGVRLYQKLSRPNIMIKVPGTNEGIPAVKALLEQGISVNITLLFSVNNYVKVAETYCSALRNRMAKGEAVDKVRSVASFFVSRVDSSVDNALNDIGSESAKSLRGKFGIANSKLAYVEYQRIFEGDSFSDLRDKGAAVQKPLWASTSTKNPEYPDLLYIEELVGNNTVNTIPHATLEALVDHGEISETLTKNTNEAKETQKSLSELGVNLEEILNELQIDGVKKFSDSFLALNKTITKKLGN